MAFKSINMTNPKDLVRLYKIKEELEKKTIIPMGSTDLIRYLITFYEKKHKGK